MELELGELGNLKAPKLSKGGEFVDVHLFHKYVGAYQIMFKVGALPPAIALLFTNAKNEFEEIHTFHFGFEGRKLLLQEKRLIYRSSVQQVRRFTKVGPTQSIGRLSYFHTYKLIRCLLMGV